jgi:diaminopimelate epimerase
VSQVPLEQVGPLLENAPAFPRRINAHFVQVYSPEEVTMRTWERGSGITLACGTGACAVAVAGVLTLHLEVEAGRVERVCVDMGEPILEADKIPTTLPGPRVVNVPLEKVPDTFFEGLDPRMTCVSMGNPHVVLYCEDVAQVPLERVGPLLENARIFPRRINAHFVQVRSPEEVTMRTWERGSGITLACGTGACAVAVAGVLTGRTGRNLLAHLPGGDLQLRWDETDNHVYMTGPAVEVFSGDWPE